MDVEGLGGRGMGVGVGGIVNTNLTYQLVIVGCEEDGWKPLTSWPNGMGKKGGKKRKKERARTSRFVCLLVQTSAG